LTIGFLVRFSGGPPPMGLVLGLCLGLSSTAIAMQTLIEQHRMAEPVGRISLSVLLFQDLMVVPILFVVGMLAHTGQHDAGLTSLVISFAEAFATVAAIMLAGRFLVGPLLRSAVRTGSRDPLMALALLILVAAALATGAAGLSIALGAFLAGLLLSDSEARHQIEIDLEPFKGLLLGIFFIMVGTRVDLAGAVTDLGWIVGGVIALLVVKTLVLFLVARAFGVAAPIAAETALLLSQAGEFAFVVIGVAQTGSLLSPRVASATIAVVALSMMATPVMAVLGRRAAAALEKHDGGAHAPDSAAAELEQHIVVGGLGRVGLVIVAALEAENVPYIAVDVDGDRVADLRARGHKVYFGDAGRPELLEKVGAARARAFVVTVDDGKAAERMIAAARRIAPDAPVYARASDAAHAARLVALGAVGVIPETVEASVQLAGRVLEGLDLAEDVVTQRLAAMRATELGRLKAGTQAG
jgi:CPA2 family monovalent cation:H+ antiporter-2